MTVTLMGGDMQAQGHAQLLVNILDLGANLQAAADMARFRHSQVSNVLSLETPLYDLVGAKLAAMGHTVKSVDGEEVGGVQILMFVADPSRRQPRRTAPSMSPATIARDRISARTAKQSVGNASTMGKPVSLSRHGRRGSP